ncbi:beta-galactosidase [Chryseobacterium sp. Leaf180]|uniref:glycoside hydrolase family 35 protein n=1 Tax=Chryseobacterium sp. Leaf180 TaxID=1736289 RepID=UPI000700960C|nr:beta-galactosidase [Chryseobacterium sp. Leaf180]KQR95498.1 beta-galactosidase [Chryseobacterium sp. Leaf180]
MKKIWVLLFLLTMMQNFQSQKKERFALGDRDFLLDGKPFQMISGEMHCARIPRENWRDRMKMAKAMGLNTIGTYVFWNAHEETPGTYDFKGNNDIAAFVKTAQEEGLYVVLRPSPYVCAEWEFGGYPWWLLKNPELKVRSTDPEFLTAYTRYIKQLAKELVPLQITHGGNILMIQLENEYGSYSDDKNYLEINKKIFRDAGFDSILFTCDGADMMGKGFLPGLLPAVNGLEDPEKVKEIVNRYHNGKGPYYVAEWYPGWFDNWGKKHAKVSAENSAKTLDKLLAAGISVNMYMFHGGTTRGFMNGANMNVNDPYAPQVSSYDYDAPLDEAGNPTGKFYAFREVIKKYLPKDQKLPEIPKAVNTVSIDNIEFTSFASLYDILPKPMELENPLSFEELGQAYGFVLYRTMISESGTVSINGFRDFASVFLNGNKVKDLDRRLNENELSLVNVKENSTMDILVENNGRINYGPFLTDNRKGITEDVRLNKNKILSWKMYSLPFKEVKQIKFLNKPLVLKNIPGFYRAEFVLKTVGDTYLDMRKFGKGFVFLNGKNLGKYWKIGPQQTIYVPAAWLKKGKNELVVFDALKSGHTTISTVSKPILDQNQ